MLRKNMLTQSDLLLGSYLLFLFFCLQVGHSGQLGELRGKSPAAGVLSRWRHHRQWLQWRGERITQGSSTESMLVPSPHLKSQHAFTCLCQPSFLIRGNIQEPTVSINIHSSSETVIIPFLNRVNIHASLELTFISPSQHFSPRVNHLSLPYLSICFSHGNVILSSSSVISHLV